mgnify:CR=1 FL=1
MTTFGSFSFDVPHGFEDRSQVILLGPIEDDFQENILVTKDPSANGDLAAYVDEQVAAFEADADGYTVKAREERQVSGKDAIALEHVFDSDGVPVAQLQVYVDDGDSIVVIAFTHHADHFAAAKDRAAGFLASMTL